MSDRRSFATGKRPPSGGRVLSIYNHPAGHPKIVVIVSRTPFEYWFHWEGRTRPHFNPKSKCPGCKVQAPLRYAGLLQIWEPKTNSQSFLSITLPVIQSLESHPDLTSNLRGTIVQISRSRATAKSTLEITPVGVYDPLERVPAPANPLATLMRVWGVDLT